MPASLGYKSGNDTIALHYVGDYYFLCTFSSHCTLGMKMKVTVLGAATPLAPAVTPAIAPTVTLAIAPAPVPPPSVKTPAPTPVVKPPIGHKSSAIRLIVGLIFGFVAMALVLGLLILRCRRRGSCLGKVEPNKSSLELLDTTSRPFTYRELSSFTKNFSDNKLLSSGGFGDVFKGTLPSSAFIAVKQIRRNKMQGVESFLAEATSLGQIRHRNLLRLRGWCQAKEGLLLVYDFMCNGSLDQWKYRPSLGINDEALHLEAQDLSWNMRLSILAGVASGLVYLHEEWQQCILHRDIKLGKQRAIRRQLQRLLGRLWVGALGRPCCNAKTTLLAGTLGYMAPEMQYTRRASIETDAYAFGILVLEIVWGGRALNLVAIGDSTEHYVLVESVWQAHEAGHILRVVDPRLWNGDNDYDNSGGSMNETRLWNHDDDYGNSGGGMDGTMIGKVLQLGLLCCLPSPCERPSMRFVNQWFQSGAGRELPRLPDRKPSLNWNAFTN